MSQPSLGFKFGSIVWSLLVAAALIVLAVSALLPSTKSAKIDLEELRRLRERQQAAALAATLPATMPAATSAPATQP